MHKATSPMKTRQIISVLLLILTALAPVSSKASTPLGTTFMYQGLLTDGTTPLHGYYDFTFTLYDASSVGSM